MYKLHLVVRLQFWSTWEYGVLHHCHNAQVHSEPEVSFMGQIDLLEIMLKIILNSINTLALKNIATKCLKPYNCVQNMSDIYTYFPWGRIWHKVFFKVGIRKGGCAWTEIHALLVRGSPGLKARFKWVIAFHWFTKCNVNPCL